VPAPIERIPLTNHRELRLIGVAEAQHLLAN
jgi:hypothetical protein